MKSNIYGFQEHNKTKLNSNISVAMCTFNGELFLPEQLESIARQTVLPNELIVCDDNSTDATLRILKDFQEKSPFNLKIYRNASRLGSTKNFEKAISLCNESIIVLSDQDDIWLPYKMERIAQVFRNYSKIGYVFSDAMIVNERLQSCGYTMWERISFTLHQREDFKQGVQLEILLKHNVATGATMAFRKELRKWILPIPEQWIHDAWIALLLSAAQIKGTLIEEVLIKYRQHSNQFIGTEKLCFTEQLRKAHNTKLDSYGILSKSFEDILNRLILMDKLKVNTKLLIKSNIKHLKIRQEIHEIQRWKRFYWVFKELLNNRYHRFSNGWKSAVKDLLL